MNSAVLEAIHPEVASWVLVIFDEAHRLTPTARTVCDATGDALNMGMVPARYSDDVATGDGDEAKAAGTRAHIPMAASAAPMPAVLSTPETTLARVLGTQDAA